MKKLIKILALTGAMALGATSLATAQGNFGFTQDLTVGSTGSEVVALQQHLVAQGYLVMPAGVAMGYFGSLTKAAVAKWQASNGVAPAVGYFGPLSRAALSGMGGISNSGAATIYGVSVKNTSSDTGAVVLANSRTVTWQTTNFPIGARVDINLLKKTSDYPTVYALVRTVSKNTVNDSSEIWFAQSGETSNDIYIEVVCSNTSQFKSGCKSGQPVMAN